MELTERISRYLSMCPAAVSGQGGHDATFYVACQLYNGFGLSVEEVYYWLNQYNVRCLPPWKEAQLMHKAKQASIVPHSKPRGHLIGGNGSFKKEDMPVLPKPKPPKVYDSIAEIEKYLSGFRASEADLSHASSELSLDWKRDGLLLIQNLFLPGEKINFITDYTLADTESGRKKANPAGWGEIVERDVLIKRWSDNPMPQSEAGGWLRINPVDGLIIKNTAGNDTTNTDKNVTAFRHALIEFDKTPMDLQLSFFARAPLPISAIISSGGKSVHAWVKVDAEDLEEYKDVVSEIKDILIRFGADGKNQNPSRLSRLPGVQRTIEREGSGEQRLLYLNPNPKQKPIIQEEGITP